MKRILVSTLITFFSLISICFAQDFVPGEVLVKWKKGVSLVSVQNTTQALGMKTKRKFATLRIHQMKLPRGMKVKTALADLKQNPNLEYAEPNYILRVLATPNDAQFDQLWGLHNTGQTGGTADADIDAPEAWDIHTGSRDVAIAVIDSGVAYSHLDLAANIWTNPTEAIGDANGDGFPGIQGVDDDGDGLIDEDSQRRQPWDPGYTNDLKDDDDENGYVDDIRGWDFVGGDNDPTDYYNIYSLYCHGGHGTHVAGTIAALGNNGVGITGVNWYASIMPIRFVGSWGGGDTAKAIEAILYAVDNGAKVINASWGGRGYSQALYDAISYANDRGCLFVAAAGNSGDDNDLNPFYPASYDLPNIIAVAATDHNDTLADFSNYGATSVDVAAPGVSILSSVPLCDVDPAEVSLFTEDFASGRENWTSWGTNDQWEISSAHWTSDPNSLADSPSENYLDGTESYITTLNTPLNLVDKLAWMELDLRCELDEYWYDYMAVGGNLGGDYPPFIALCDLGSCWDSVFFGSTLEPFSCLSPITDGFCWYAVDISALGDFSTAVNIGFMFYSEDDSSPNYDGVYIDTVVVKTQDLIITGFDYNSLDGTSMAAPHVSGVAGLILARYPTITLQELKDRILNTVDSIPNLQGKVLTGGRINAYKALDPTYNAELVVDFGAIGIWQYDGGWSNIGSGNPSALGAYANKLVAEFSSGLYEYNGSWTKIASSDCEDMAGVGTELYVDFGSIGLWKYNGGWTKVATSNPSELGVYGNTLVVEFSSGLYEYDGSWTKIAGSDCEGVVGVGSDLYVDFGSIGLWKYNGGWTKVAGSNIEDMTAVDLN